MLYLAFYLTYSPSSTILALWHHGPHYDPTPSEPPARLAWDERRERKDEERNGNWLARLGELHGVVLLRKGGGDGWLRAVLYWGREREPEGREEVAHWRMVCRGLRGDMHLRIIR